MRWARGIPWSLWLFAATGVGASLVGASLTQDSRSKAEVWVVLGAAVLLTAAVLLGRRVAWWTATLFMAVVVLISPFSPPVRWWAFALNVITLAALLAPSSR